MSCKCDTINIINDNNIIVVSHADGRDGKSAYQQAVEGGYAGTEQEFSCSLSLLADVAEGKKQIADAINYKGGEAEATQAFTELAEEIKEIPNFNTNGCEYISDVYKPTTLLDAYYNRYYLKSVIDNYVKEISVSYTFSYCGSLQNIQLPNLITINGGYTFSNCGSLQTVGLPQLTSYPSYLFGSTQPLNITLGVLIKMSTIQNNLTKARNIKIGQGTNINLPLHFWTATNVISEGQSGIDELNSNLRTNLLEKLYDHSQDGQTRTLRLGWLAHVTQENIDYANSKGWTLTT